MPINFVLRGPLDPPFLASCHSSHPSRPLAHGAVSHSECLATMNLSAFNTVVGGASDMKERIKLFTEMDDDQVRSEGHHRLPSRFRCRSAKD